jgi:hypothetical protein
MCGATYWAVITKLNSTRFTFLTDDGKRARIRKVVFEPNEMLANVQHTCHIIIMEDILILHTGNTRPQSNIFVFKASKDK